MPLIRNIFISLGTITLASGFYLHKQKVSLQNQYLRATLSLLHNQNPQYSAFLLKQMIRFSMISRCEQMKDYVFSYGFDLDGFYLNGLSQIGFDTVEVGPVSLIPSSKQEERVHFGNKIALGNINWFWEQKEQKYHEQKGNQQGKQQSKQQQQTYLQQRENRKQSKIGVCITPNFQILNYAPYLIEQNMLYCLKQFQQLNQSTSRLKVHRYILKLNEPSIKQLHTQQYLTMIRQLITNVNNATRETYENNKKQFADSSQTIQRPQVLVEIPNQDQNQKVYNMVKEMPQVERLIVDRTEFEIVRTNEKEKEKGKWNKKYTNTNNSQTVVLTLGKKRITFNQLLEKVVSDTL